MSLLARRKRAPASSFDPYEDDALESQFYAGERICPPPVSTRGSSILRVCMVILFAAGGWWLLRHPESWQGWVSTKFATASALMDGRELGSVPAMAPPDDAGSAEPTSQIDTASLQPPSDGSAAEAATPAPAQALTTVATAPADNGFSVSPLPPPAADPADPYRARAVAVGLHPDLSRVLLSRLSPTDYRNAGVAIKTALAKTPDAGTFVWPQQRRPELALFEVHFVAGAAACCRRYVVTVTKDRWSTTAAPVEKCGSGLASRRK
jgi:hypothetical protein